MTQNEMSGAIFNVNKTCRYVLWRRWDNDKPMVMFIGLNPSKANASEPDNTIIKVSKIARNNGYGGFYMLNLFAYVSTDPGLLVLYEDFTLDNSYLREYAACSKKVVFCWGAFKQAKARAEEVKCMFPAACCLEHLLDGSPKHPLYCLDKTILKPYKTLV